MGATTNNLGLDVPNASSISFQPKHPVFYGNDRDWHYAGEHAHDLVRVCSTTRAREQQKQLLQLWLDTLRGAAAEWWKNDELWTASEREDWKVVAWRLVEQFEGQPASPVPSDAELLEAFRGRALDEEDLGRRVGDSTGAFVLSHHAFAREMYARARDLGDLPRNTLVGPTIEKLPEALQRALGSRRGREIKSWDIWLAKMLEIGESLLRVVQGQIEEERRGAGLPEVQSYDDAPETVRAKRLPTSFASQRRPPCQVLPAQRGITVTIGEPDPVAAAIQRVRKMRQSPSEIPKGGHDAVIDDSAIYTRQDESEMQVTPTAGPRSPILAVKGREGRAMRWQRIRTKTSSGDSLPKSDPPLTNGNANSPVSPEGSYDMKVVSPTSPSSSSDGSATSPTSPTGLPNVSVIFKNLGDNIISVELMSEGGVDKPSCPQAAWTVYPRCFTANKFRLGEPHNFKMTCGRIVKYQGFFFTKDRCDVDWNDYFS